MKCCKSTVQPSTEVLILCAVAPCFVCWDLRPTFICFAGIVLEKNNLSRCWLILQTNKFGLTLLHALLVPSHLFDIDGELKVTHFYQAFSESQCFSLHTLIRHVFPKQLRFVVQLPVNSLPAAGNSEIF